MPATANGRSGCCAPMRPTKRKCAAVAEPVPSWTQWTEVTPEEAPALFEPSLVQSPDGSFDQRDERLLFGKSSRQWIVERGQASLVLPSQRHQIVISHLRMAADERTGNFRAGKGKI